MESKQEKSGSSSPEQIAVEELTDRLTALSSDAEILQSQIALNAADTLDSCSKRVKTAASDLDVSLGSGKIKKTELVLVREHRKKTDRSYTTSKDIYLVEKSDIINFRIGHFARIESGDDSPIKYLQFNGRDLDQISPNFEELKRVSKLVSDICASNEKERLKEQTRLNLKKENTFEVLSGVGGVVLALVVVGGVGYGATSLYATSDDIAQKYTDFDSANPVVLELKGAPLGIGETGHPEITFQFSEFDDATLIPELRNVYLNWDGRYVVDTQMSRYLNATGGRDASSPANISSVRKIDLDYDISRNEDGEIIYDKLCERYYIGFDSENDKVAVVTGYSHPEDINVRLDGSALKICIDEESLGEDMPIVGDIPILIQKVKG